MDVRFGFRFVFRSLLPLTALSYFLLSNTPTEAQSLADQDQAYRLFQRITGQTPTQAELQQMLDEMAAGRTDRAALVAINSSNLGFYKSTLMDMFSRLSNLEGDRKNGRNLDDFTATIIGLVYNGEDFSQVFGDALYIGRLSYSQYYYREDDNNDPANPIRSINLNGNPLISVVRGGDSDDFLSLSGERSPNPHIRPLLYANDGNAAQVELRREGNDRLFNHYRDLQEFENWPELLTKYSQAQMWSYVRDDRRVAPEDVMGVVTLPEFAEYAFEAGTNRRPFKMIMQNFMCKKMEQIRDATAPDFRVRTDVARDEGYQTDCRSCHAQMDGMSGAFAFFDFRGNGGGQIFYDSENLTDELRLQDSENGNGVKKQWRQWVNFSREPDRGNTPIPLGHVIRNNSWYNVMNVLPFRTPPSGKSAEEGFGAAHLGEVLANSPQFSTCMAQRAYERVCLDSLAPNPEDSPAEVERKQSVIAALAEIAAEYEQGISDYSDFNASSPYNMKALFARVSAACFGGGAEQ